MTPLETSVSIGAGPTGHKTQCSLVSISQLNRLLGALSLLSHKSCHCFVIFKNSSLVSRVLWSPFTLELGARGQEGRRAQVPGEGQGLNA